MRVTIAYPPDFNPPTMPFGTLPLFNAVLKSAGHDTHVVDLNAEAFTVMLRPENLERYFALLDGYTTALASKPDRTAEETRQYETYRSLYLYPREQMREARDAAEALRNAKAFYDPKAFTRANRIIRTTHTFLHALTPKLDPRNNTFIESLYAHLADETPDPYVDVWENHTIPTLKRIGVEVIAMSCPFSPQIAMAMRFAKFVKRRMPHVKFIVGGTGISDSQDILLTDPRFYDFIDYPIVGDGEEALTLCLDAIAGKVTFDEVPGLWQFKAGECFRPAMSRLVDMDASPCPDYDDVDFSHYMLPEKAGFYTTSRGCYYGKCTFCPESFRVGFRMRSPENVYADIRKIVSEQGVKYIHFFDPLTPPRTLAHLSREVARENLPLRWHAEVKFEKIYTSRDYIRNLSRGGCSLLQFGFESGVQRVLDGMQKGNKLDQIEIMLGNLQDHHINVAVTWFIGFPTESENDAKETWRYLRRHSDQIHLSLYTGTFGLGHDVPVFQHPEDYDIKLLFDAEGNPTYTRNDGHDWDQQPLHKSFHVRSDIPLAISGAALLYAANHPELLAELRGMNATGPVAWEEPTLRDRVASVPHENGYLDLGVDAKGAHRYKIFVAQSGDSFDADEADVALLRRIGHTPTPLSAVLDDPKSPSNVEERIRAFVDRGCLETPDPAVFASLSR